MGDLELRRQRITDAILSEQLHSGYRTTDRMFAVLMLVQWLAGIAIAVWISPRTWSGTTWETHPHVWAALILGGLTNLFPALLACLRPGEALTRHVIAVGQVLTSALLIHLTGGRLETHFHVFGSLAFIAFYRDWKVLIPATLVVAVDHLVRGIYFPQSVFGVLTPESWRWAEHAGWVLFEDFFLVVAIRGVVEQMREAAQDRAQLVLNAELTERAVEERTRELLAAKLEAEQASRAKAEFLATMSHEIRTPLNAIVGMTGLLLETQQAPEQRDYAETIRTSGDCLLSLINEILDFSKIEAGRLDLEHAVFDLRACVEDALDLVSAQAHAKDLELSCEFAPNLCQRYVGDASRVRQVLVNLLANAVKFTDTGEVVLRVGVTGESSSDEQEIEIAVRDTGIGIAADQQGRIFQSFTQADGGSARKFGGTGLGLAISRAIATAMGGDIQVDSEYGRGSTFRFRFRALAAQDAPDREDSDLRGMRLMIVDDNETNRGILCALARSWRMQVWDTGDPRVALARLRRDPTGFEFALLDYNMPGIDGVTLAVEMRALAAAEQLTILVLSSGGVDSSEVRVAWPTVQAVLSKPVRQSRLFDAMLDARAGQPRTRARTSPEPADVLPSLRILLAEDNLVNQKVARLMLERLGQRADVVANGVEVVHAIESRDYDLVLMDCQMPELDGYEATRRIRSRIPSERQPYIVAMTANALQGDREACLAAGMDDYLAKPVNPEQLRAAVASVVRKNAAPGDPESRSD